MVCCWSWEVSGVIDTDTDGDCAEWTFPAEPDAVRTARHAVRDTLRSWGLDPVVSDMTVLLVSELVTNSLRYASGPIGVRLLRLESDGGVPSLLVEVSDPVPDPPHRTARHNRRRGRPRAPAGRLLVPALGHPAWQNRQDRVVRAASRWLKVEGTTITVPLGSK